MRARSGGNSTSTDEWNDIPIYPGATDLSDEGETLSYTVEASMEDLVSFYEKNMEELGWKKFASGDAESMFEIYEKGSRIAVITAMEGFAAPGTLIVVIAVQ